MAGFRECGVSVVMRMVLLALVLSAASARAAENPPQDFRLQVLAEGLHHPWALAFLPEGDLLVTERRGRLLQIDPGSGAVRTILGTPEVAVAGQGGLLDVALHPDFADNQWLYLSYALATDEGATTAVGRGQLMDGRLQNFAELFRAHPASKATQHFGSRLLLTDDGHLFITIGDRGRREQAQRLDNHAGKVIRLTWEGGVPGDNPFMETLGALPEIYSYGHRNPQGLALHPISGQVWLHEHGPRGGDEINVLAAGANYGWPLVTYGREYHGPKIGAEPPQPGFVSPLHHWTPSIAPSGMAFCSGDRFPGWRGDLFVGALAHRHLLRLRLHDGAVVEQEELLADRGWRIRDVRSGPDGHLYLLTDADRGVLARLEPAMAQSRP